MNFLSLQKFMKHISPMDILVTSDLHFSHTNIIKGTSNWDDKSQCRDFNNENEHNRKLIDNINSMVNPNTVLIHCGDFAFGKEENIVNMAEEILCPIIEILGNHDNKIRSNILNQNAFMACLDYFELKVNGHMICFCHYPISEWNSINRGSILCYGHTHQFTNDFKNRSMNVGVEANNYFPHRLSDIIQKMETVSFEKIHHNGQRA